MSAFYIIQFMHLWCVVKVEVNMKLPFLQDFMALLAYQEPEKSPVFHLLSPEYRQQVADRLNRAILGRLTRPYSLRSAY